MPMPGAGDSYFYEWYVGMEKVIEMLNPDSGIKHVIFQHDEYDTIDDVVVEYNSGKTQVCYQVKHNIETAAPDSLTFGKMLERTKDKACLFEAMFQGWKNAIAISNSSTKPVLFTNRIIHNRRAGRHYNGKSYSAYSIDNFVSKIQNVIEEQIDKDDLIIEDKDLCYQWKELCTSLANVDAKELRNFLRDFHIEGNQPSLREMKQTLLNMLGQTFSCNDGVASELFSKLLLGLTEWTTTGRQCREVTIEDVYSVLGIEGDKDDSQHRLTHPYPFFESRKTFCEKIVSQIQTTTNKVVFISGDPGSGKTSIVSYIQSEYDLFFLRYHTFRPISLEQRFYNTDPGMCTAENLWGTLLIQLRNKLKGRLAKHNVPVSNKLVTVDQLRGHVMRLLGVLAQESVESGEKINICIDGIDHAARSNISPSFLESLPSPEEIPDGVCFIIVGQPTTLYRDQYPIWLSTDTGIERINMPRLGVTDIIQLIVARTNQFNSVATNLAELIYQKTEGNNLSAVFAVEEIRSVLGLEEAVAKIQNSGISGDIQQYYNHIWMHMKKELSNMVHSPVYPESIVACPLLLMNGRVNTKILAEALNYGLSQNDWCMVLDGLFPLVNRTEIEGEYALFHNDFRVFLMSIMQRYQSRYKEIALALAEYLLQNDEGLLSYTLGIPLLQCADRKELIPHYFTAAFVIDALAEGVAEERLDEFAHLSYLTACNNKDFEGYRNTYFAVKTLYQHKQYYEYFDKKYRRADYPEISTIDISEIKTLPIELKNIDEYSNVLSRCAKLYSAGKEEYTNRSLALYHKWFDGYSPLSFVHLCPATITDENAWEIRTSEVGLLLQQWGNIAARLKIEPPEEKDGLSNVEWYAISTFGEQYFNYCIDNSQHDLAMNAMRLRYVPKQVFCKKLEDIYYAGSASEFDSILTKVSPSKENPTWNLMALAMKISIDSSYLPERSFLDSTPTLNRIHDESSFVLVLKSFLRGRIEYNTDDDTLISYANEYCSDIEGKEFEESQCICLARTAVLLGKYYWNDEACSDMFEGYCEWFLTASLERPFDYSKAHRFLLFTLLHSNGGYSLGSTGSFINALRTNLFEIRLLGMFYKTDILDFLISHNRMDIVKEYIEVLYGENCCEICKEENKADMHERFRPYGDLVNSEMMAQFTAQLKWDVVGYSGHKEYAMHAPLECFDEVVKSKPSKWSEYGRLLYRQSKIADRYNNRASNEIDNSLTKAAVFCGISDYWELRKWSDDFRLKPDQIYQSLFEFINVANDINDIKAIWILCCGIHSWYRQEERYGAKNIYYECLKKAACLNFDFAAFVADLTPQWSSIISYLSDKSDHSEEYAKNAIQRTAAREKLYAHYNELSLEDSLDFLVNKENTRDSMDHYNAVFEKIIAFEGDCSLELTRFINSFSVYLQGKEWSHENIDHVMAALIDRKKEEAFWCLAESIYNRLSDYDYQISTRNMQLLFKLYCDKNSDEMESLFYEEVRTQELWITGNGHFDIDDDCEFPEILFSDSPESLAELALYILLEQINTQNARKMESAIYAIYLLGTQFPEIMKIVSEKWSILSQNQEECLLIVIAKWAAKGMCSEELHIFIRDMYVNCTELIRKYYLHSILLKLKDTNVQQDNILFDSPAKEYQLPDDGVEEYESCFENFLRLIEDYSNNGDVDAIRRYLFDLPTLETYVEDPYGETGDSKLPTINTLPGNIFYAKEKTGVWNDIPLRLKKARLLPPEDPFILTELPQMTFDNEWFPDVDRMIDTRESKSLTQLELHTIAHNNIDDFGIVLAACIWYPWGHNDGTIYFESSKIDEDQYLFEDNSFDKCICNFGLLANENAMDESSCSTFGKNGVSLFNQVCGGMKFIFGNCQLAPSSIWRDNFECVPLDNDPYIWINKLGKKVLWFERIASPIREGLQEAYVRQPLLFRWVCDEEWLNTVLERNNLCIYPIFSQYRYPDFTYR